MVVRNVTFYKNKSLFSENTKLVLEETLNRYQKYLAETLQIVAVWTDITRNMYGQC